MRAIALGLLPDIVYLYKDGVECLFYRNVAKARLKQSGKKSGAVKDKGSQPKRGKNGYKGKSANKGKTTKKKPSKKKPTNKSASKIWDKKS